MDHPYAFRQIVPEEVIGLIDWFLEARAQDAVRSSLAVLTRGMPGGGKTILSKIVEVYALAKGLTVCICSADRFFETDQGYMFFHEGLQDAHAACFEQFRNALRRHVDIVIVDNTNIRVSEFERYVEHVRGRHYHHIFSIHCSSEQEALWQARRGVHPVPEDVIRRRFRDFETANLDPSFSYVGVGTVRFNNTWIEPRDAAMF